MRRNSRVSQGLRIQRSHGQDADTVLICHVAINPSSS